MTGKILESLAALLPGADETVLGIVAEAVVQQILNYTNLDALPEQLVTPAVLIAKAYYKAGGFDGSEQTVASVKRGDVQTNFGAEKSAVDFAGTGFFGYKAMLDPFRKLRW